MFDTILSGCDGIRQQSIKWSGNQCGVMRVPDMECASLVQALLTILLCMQEQCWTMSCTEMTNQYPTTWSVYHP